MFGEPGVGPVALTFWRYEEIKAITLLLSMKTEILFPVIGPKSGEVLRAVGITSLQQLRELGSVRAYVMVKRAVKSNPGLNFKPSLNFLWGLEGVLTGEHWRDIAKNHRTSLLLALEQEEKNYTEEI